MKLKINGKEEVVDADSLTMTRLLEIVKVENPGMVSVQLNGEFVGKENFDLTLLKDRDEVDFLYFMGGGRAGCPGPDDRGE